MKIEDASEQEVVTFLTEEFHPVKNFEIEDDQRAKDMACYARMARQLSNEQAVKKMADTLADLLEMQVKKTRYVRKGGQVYRVVGNFSNALKLCATHFGFSSDLVILNGSVAPAVFSEQVYSKRLFRDVFTRPHGEFTHALQWLMLGMMWGPLAAELYSRSVKYVSKSEFSSGSGSKRIVMWNFLVDCFEGAENYQTNILCKTFRCPQVFTNRLSEVLPARSWLGEFISARRHKGLKSGAQAYEDGHYVNGREVTMPKHYLGRTVNYADSDEQKTVYEAVADNVWRKVALEGRPVMQHEQGFQVINL